MNWKFERRTVALNQVNYNCF